MEISVLSKLDALVEIVNPVSKTEEDTYLGFAVRKQDVPSLLTDIEELVRQKYAGLTYADLLDEDAEPVMLAAHLSGVSL